MGSCRRHIVTVIGVTTLVTMTTAGIRRPPGEREVGAMAGECEKCRYLLHVGHAAHVPLTDVLVEGRRLIEHPSVRRHAADGGREGGLCISEWYTASVWGRARE